MYSRRNCSFKGSLKVRRHFGADIPVNQIFRILHCLRRPAHVHQDHSRIGGGNHGRHCRIKGHRADVIDDLRPRLQSRRGNSRFARIDADNRIGPSLFQRADHGNDPLNLQRHGRLRGSRTCGFCADINGTGSGVQHLHGAADGFFRFGETASHSRYQKSSVFVRRRSPANGYSSVLVSSASFGTSVFASSFTSSGGTSISSKSSSFLPKGI